MHPASPNKAQYHSLIEMRCYAVRFMHQLHLIRSLRGILRTKYDQYNSLIRPLEKYLADHGANFVSGATVTDMDIRIEGNDKTVTALHIGEGCDAQIVPVAEKDLVFFTNGSMTQNSTQGSMTEAPVMNRDTVHKGCFPLWEKLAAKCPEYGHPKKFAFDPDKSNFVSCSVTVRDYAQLGYVKKTIMSADCGGSCKKCRGCSGLRHSAAAKVSLESGTASVSFERPVSDEVLTQAVETAGFDVLEIRR